jgi:hypothetical protein
MAETGPSELANVRAYMLIPLTPVTAVRYATPRLFGNTEGVSVAIRATIGLFGVLVAPFRSRPDTASRFSRAPAAQTILPESTG